MSVYKIRNWAWPFIKNFRTYIDIGASDGDTSLDFLNDFKSIIAFEPNPESFELLSKHLTIESYNFALGESACKTQLIVPKNGVPGWGSTSILRTQHWTDGTVYEVEMRTLDSFNFYDVDFIKIDVEQAELQVILGSLETIKKNLPVIMFENKRNENIDVVRILQNLNYKIIAYKGDTIAYHEE